MPQVRGRVKELANRPLIRDHAFGKALDPDKLEKLSRYEVHLDRNSTERFAMLLRLQELRRSSVRLSGNIGFAEPLAKSVWQNRAAEAAITVERKSAWQKSTADRRQIRLAKSVRESRWPS